MQLQYQIIALIHYINKMNFKMSNFMFFIFKISISILFRNHHCFIRAHYFKSSKFVLFFTFLVVRIKYNFILFFFFYFCCINVFTFSFKCGLCFCLNITNRIKDNLTVLTGKLLIFYIRFELFLEILALLSFLLLFGLF